MTSLTSFASPMSDELILRQKIRSSLADWATFALAARDHAPARHHLLIIAALEALTHGDTKQLMLLLPPGSAKSTYASLLFPAWWMAQNPTASVISASHTASLAESFGRGVRMLISDHSERLDLELRPDARAAGRFATTRGGEYFAIGVHGGVTGRRADLALIDDPVRSFVDAESSAARDRLWNWYRSELVTRLKPNGRVILIMTRWHSDDIAGRLLQQDGWKVLRLPALAELPDPMNRAAGEALWPEWEDREALIAKQTTLGDRCFAALFQQAPLADSGRLFDLSKIQLLDIVPVGTSVRAWDLAGVGGQGGDPDWTAGVKLSQSEQGSFVVEDVRRVRLPATEVAALIRDVAEQDGETVAIGLPRDPGQAGIYQVAMLTRMLAGFRVQSTPEEGPKIVRADPVASQVSAGNLYVRRATWNQIFLEELAAFPHGKKDDQVDALSRAFRMLAVRPQAAHFRSLPFLDR